jgi:DtxR family Mn-dependent transcriptional regulator
MPKVKSVSSRKTTVRSPESTSSVQDYLGAIYDLEGSSGHPVIGARLAKHLGVSPPAVTEALQRMLRVGLVRVGPGKEIAFTKKGRALAEVMARRHRLLECWLTNTLGLNWTDAHEEAHRLEHAISLRVEERLAVLLGRPSTCPHGNPIPGMPVLRRPEGVPLEQIPEGATVVVERITEEAEADPRLLEYLWKHEVKPGARLVVEEAAPWAGTITVMSRGDAGRPDRRIVLGLAAAAQIRVRPQE